MRDPKGESASIAAGHFNSSSWYVRRPQAQAKLRLFCLSYAGGSAAVYKDWQVALGPEVEVVSIQLPGRANRWGEPLFHSIPELVLNLLASVRQLFDMPFVFFGHSLGGLLAYELCQHMTDSDRGNLKLIIASGCSSPRDRSPSKELHLMEDTELKKALSEFGGTPTEILSNADMMSVLLPTIRADFALAENYSCQWRDPIGIPITAFAGKDDEHVSEMQVASWQLETTGPLKTVWFDGGHFFLHQSSQHVLQEVRNELGLISRSNID